MPKRRLSGNSFSLSSFLASGPVTRSRVLTADEACDGILTRLENTEVPLDSPTIARSFGDSCNIWTIRENLYRLEDMGMIRKIDQDGWILSQNDKRTDQEVEIMKREVFGPLVPDIPVTDPIDCGCPNAAGSRCHHIHNHNHHVNNITNNNYYQIGENNTIIHGTETDFGHFQREQPTVDREQ